MAQEMYFVCFQNSKHTKQNSWRQTQHKLLFSLTNTLFNISCACKKLNTDSKANFLKIKYLCLWTQLFWRVSKWGGFWKKIWNFFIWSRMGKLIWIERGDLGTSLGVIGGLYDFSICFYSPLKLKTSFFFSNLITYLDVITATFF